jgi:hypothetical protein
MPQTQSMTDAVKRTAKRISDTYKSGMAETASLPGEIGAKSQQMRDADIALHPEKAAAPKAAPSAPSPQDKVNAAPYGSRPGEKVIDTKDMVKPLGSFKRGTRSVPKTGIYKLEEGEAVVPEKSNPDSHKKTGEKDMAGTPYDMITGGKKDAPKVIHHHEYHKTHNGKHVVTHKHHDPSHKDEQHMFEKFSDAADHMEQNPPQPEPTPAASPDAAAGAGPAAGAAPTAAPAA